MKTLIAATVLLLAACLQAEEPQAAPAQEPLTPRQDLPGLTNYAKVSEALHRGAQPTAEGFAELKKMGIKTVVNLRSFHSDRGKLQGTGLQYVHIYCKAWHPEEERHKIPASGARSKEPARVRTLPAWRGPHGDDGGGVPRCGAGMGS